MTPPPPSTVDLTAFAFLADRDAARRGRMRAIVALGLALAVLLGAVAVLFPLARLETPAPIAMPRPATPPPVARPNRESADVPPPAPPMAAVAVPIDRPPPVRREPPPRRDTIAPPSVRDRATPAPYRNPYIAEPLSGEALRLALIRDRALTREANAAETTRLEEDR